MIKLVGGAIIGILCMEAGLSSVAIIIFCLVSALIFQVVYARSLNTFLNGKDPFMDYRCKNLKQLRTRIDIPIYLVILDIVAKAFGYASLAGFFTLFGWL